MLEEEKDDKLDAAESSSASTTDVPADSSTADAGAVATDSPATESKTPENEAPSKPEKSQRESLIAKLIGAEKDETDEPEAEQTSDEPEAPAAAKAEGTEAPASTEPAKPDVLTDEELVAPVDKHTKPQTRKRIEALIADRKAKLEELEKIKPLAQYGQSVLKLCEDNHMRPEDFGSWFAFGAAINSDPQRAPALMLAEAERMAKHLNVQLPKAGPDPAALQDIEDFIVDGITSMELSGDVAKKLLEKVRTAKKAAPPAPPAPVQQPPPTQHQQQPTQNPPVQQQDPAYAQAAQSIGALNEKYAKDYPADWPKIRDSVRAEMAKYAGTDPRHWARFFEQEVERAKAKFVVSRKAPPQTLRPTTTPAKPIPGGKAALLAELTGKGP